MRARALLALPLILTAAAITPRASAADAGVAALQVGLRSHGLYQGPIDGLTGPGTAKAVRRLQKRAHISVDGVVGPQTRKALGRFATSYADQNALDHEALVQAIEDGRVTAESGV